MLMWVVSSVHLADGSTHPNLAMFDDHPGVRVVIAGREVRFTLDTGAVNTDIYARFGEEFPALVSGAKKTTTEVRSIGGAETHESVELPELTLVIGGTPAVLRGAHMLTRQINSSRFVGNLGSDVLRQHESLLIDFESMRVELAAR